MIEELQSRNPLKSGQCFLLQGKRKARLCLPWSTSQSPQIGSMFLTIPSEITQENWLTKSRNPLKSGQCFLLAGLDAEETVGESRNPLKSGQCFLPI